MTDREFVIKALSLYDQYSARLSDEDYVFQMFKLTRQYRFERKSLIEQD